MGAEGRSRGSGELSRDPQRAISGQHLGAVREGQGCVAWYWETKQVACFFQTNGLFLSQEQELPGGVAMAVRAQSRGRENKTLAGEAAPPVQAGEELNSMKPLERLRG